MASLLKDIYSREFFDSFVNILKQIFPDFDEQKFLNSIFNSDWDKKELKERMYHISMVLHEYMPKEFDEAAKTIREIINKLRTGNVKESSIEFMFLPDYIERYGINDFETSVDLIEFVTQFTSCEFAVRKFILKYKSEMEQVMLQWSSHEHFKVRRLSTEGMRPRLPWAIAVPQLKVDPSPVLLIIENLLNDSSEFVRRSVANNLNDISKDHPDLVIAFVKKWKGESDLIDSILKHGSRTLLKQGNPAILECYGLGFNDSIQLNDFQLNTSRIQVGQDIEFQFSIQNNSMSVIKLRIEYGIYYILKNGKHSRKVFKISERKLESNENVSIFRKHSFKTITTKRFYGGEHKLSLIINGKEMQISTFELSL